MFWVARSSGYNPVSVLYTRLHATSVGFVEKQESVPHNIHGGSANDERKERIRRLLSNDSQHLRRKFVLHA